MKKKKIVIMTITMLGALVCFFVQNAIGDDENFTDLQMANLEALTQDEIDISDCESGCSTTNNTKYCCTVLGFKLYRYFQ